MIRVTTEPNAQVFDLITAGKIWPCLIPPGLSVRALAAPQPQADIQAAHLVRSSRRQGQIAGAAENLWPLRGQPNLRMRGRGQGRLYNYREHQTLLPALQEHQ